MYDDMLKQSGGGSSGVANQSHQIYLNFNASKIRWLTDSNVATTSVFAIGSGENIKKVSLWTTDLNSETFEPRLLCESDDLDGQVTEIKAKNVEELFVSTSEGTLYHLKYSPTNQVLSQLNKWSSPRNASFGINNFDFEPGIDELCSVNDNGQMKLTRIYQPQNNNNNTSDDEPSFEQKELCGLNSVKYLKQFEIATADSLGRIKLWDTRSRDFNRTASMKLNLESECSPILCMSRHPNQQHMIACGNLNGLVFVYDVRSQKKPFIMCQTHYEPVTEVCFHPFSCENLLSSSFDGSLWYWNSSSSSSSTFNSSIKTDVASWDDRSVNAKNYLPANKYSINSFDINNDHIIAVNSNFTLFKVKNFSFM